MFWSGSAHQQTIQSAGVIRLCGTVLEASWSGSNTISRLSRLLRAPPGRTGYAGDAGQVKYQSKSSSTTPHPSIAGPREMNCQVHSPVASSPPPPELPRPESRVETRELTPGQQTLWIARSKWLGDQHLKVLLPCRLSLTGRPPFLKCSNAVWTLSNQS